MREIKFRGKRIDNGEWVYGTLILTTSVEEKAYIVDSACHTFDKINDEGYAEFDWINAYPVIYETVGQCTGLKDKKGREIYKGDIIKYSSKNRKSNEIFIVNWSDEDACFTFGNIRSDFIQKYGEVINNIHIQIGK